MSVIFLLIPLSVLLATAFLCAFIWAVRSGQYEDTYTPSIRLLLQDPVSPRRPGSSAPKRETVKAQGATSPRIDDGFVTANPDAELKRNVVP